MLLVVSALFAANAIDTVTIVFNTADSNDGPNWGFYPTPSSVISSGAENIQAVTAVKNVATGKCGMKIGSNKQGGEVRIMPKSELQRVPEKIELTISANNHAEYRRFSINGVEQPALAADNTGENYKTYTLTDFSEPIDTLTITKTDSYTSNDDSDKTGFIYVGQITFYYESAVAELGDVTAVYDGVSIEDADIVEVEQGTKFVFDAANAESITLEVEDETIATYTEFPVRWTPDVCTENTVIITAKKGEETKSLGFFLSVTPGTKPLPTGAGEIVATYNGGTPIHDIDIIEVEYGTVFSFTAENADSISVVCDDVHELSIMEFPGFWTPYKCSESVVVVTAHNRAGNSTLSFFLTVKPTENSGNDSGYEEEPSDNPGGGDNEQSSIEGVSVSESGAEYYDLQGRRVVKPRRGLYIRRGSRMAKVVR